MSDRTYQVFFADQTARTIEAPTLRTVLRRIDETKTPVLAVIDTAVLPQPAHDGRPFLAVLIRNPAFFSPV